MMSRMTRGSSSTTRIRAGAPGAGMGAWFLGIGACLDLLEEQGTGQLFRAVKSGIYRASEIGVIFKLSVTLYYGDNRDALRRHVKDESGTLSRWFDEHGR